MYVFAGFGVPHNTDVRERETMMILTEAAGAMDQTTVAATEAFRVVDLIGVLCNGIIGGRIARAKRFDYVGFGVLALMSALGGGAIRDTLLNTVPVALTDPYYLGTALVGALIAFLWRMDSKWTSRMINVADGLVIGTWSATGVLKTLSLGFGILPAILMGICTAVGGGMVRDVSAGNVPKVLSRETFYVTPAIMSGLIMVGFYYWHKPMLGMGVATVVGLAAIMIAQWKSYILPEAPEITITMTPSQLRQMLRLRGIKVRRSRNEESTDQSEIVDLPDGTQIDLSEGDSMADHPDNNNREPYDN